MNVLDLFSGIGGFSLGLERAGMRTVAFCEIEPFCQAVLRKHWPHVPIYDDVRSLTAERLAADGIEVDAICGGFPCQDVSVAGRGAGIKGDRSGLWSEYARLIGELRPSYAIVENVPGLLGRGMDKVCGDLAALGYDAEWEIISAFDMGAPHIRERIWIVAYPHGEGFQKRFLHSAIQGAERRNDNGKDIAVDSWWAFEPDLVRVVHGVPGRVDRIRSLGNAVVPQIPEIIGRAIMTHMGNH